jgi:hypothetical protein
VRFARGEEVGRISFSAGVCRHLLFVRGLQVF